MVMESGIGIFWDRDVFECFAGSVDHFKFEYAFSGSGHGKIDQFHFSTSLVRVNPHFDLSGIGIMFGNIAFSLHLIYKT